jgi:hypothetical protein
MTALFLPLEIAALLATAAAFAAMLVVNQWFLGVGL